MGKDKPLETRKVKITLLKGDWMVLGDLSGKVIINAVRELGIDLGTMLSPERVLEDSLSVLIKLGMTTENWMDILVGMTPESWKEILEKRVGR